MSCTREWAAQAVKPGGTAGSLLLSRQTVYLLSGGGFSFCFRAGRRRKEKPKWQTRSPTKSISTKSEMPKAWYNLRADMKNKPAPLLNPGTLQAHDRRRAAPRVLRRAGRAGAGQHHARTSRSRRRSAISTRCTAPSPLVRAYCLEKKLRHAGEDLLQIRGQQHQRQPQAQFRHRAGVLRQKAGPQGRDDRNRRRPVGHGAVDGVRLPRSGLQGLYGQVLL